MLPVVLGPVVRDTEHLAVGKSSMRALLALSTAAQVGQFETAPGRLGLPCLGALLGHVVEGAP